MIEDPDMKNTCDIKYDINENKFICEYKDRFFQIEQAKNKKWIISTFIEEYGILSDVELNGEWDTFNGALNCRINGINEEDKAEEEYTKEQLAYFKKESPIEYAELHKEDPIGYP